MKRLHSFAIVTCLFLVMNVNTHLCPVSAATILQSSGSAHVGFEAERTGLLTTGTPTFWENRTDALASAGGALTIGGTTDNGTSPHAFVQYQIKFASPGDYFLYYRWRADEARTVADQFTANSFWIATTFGSFSTPGAASQADFYTSAANGSQAPSNNVYDWQREPDTIVYSVTQADVGSGVSFSLSVGTREAGTIVDRWVFSTDPGLTDAALDALNNSETSVVNQGSSEDFVAFEAESKGNIISGTPTFWDRRSDAAASGGAALEIGGTTDNGTSPHGFVQYEINFSKAGDYFLYYRWRADEARTVADQFTANSFWIGGTFGSLSIPGAAAQADFYTSAANGSQAPANNVYDWQREPDSIVYSVTQAELTSGKPLVLSVGTREAGSIVDRWVLSPDPNLSDAALDALSNSGARVAFPEVTRAVGSASLNTVTVFFTKALAPSSVAAGKFSVSGGLTVSGAAIDATDARRVVLTTSSQAQGTVYTVTVNGISDTSGASVAANSAVNFTAWKLVKGWATTELYQNIPGTTVDALLVAPAYEDRKPDEIRWVKGFQLNNDPRAPNIGARISAFFSPESSGAYNFYINNDDEGELLLSSDESAANLQSFGVFPVGPPVFDDFLFGTSSSLSAGRSYLLAGLLKSGGGDVFLNVAARRNNASTPSADLPVLGGNQISTFVNPDLGNVTFERQPVAVSATEGSRARFSVSVTTTEKPVYYQWQVDGSDIPGAVRAAFTTPALSVPDSGKKYSVVVSVAGKDTASGEAILTVLRGDPPNLEPYIGINFVGGGDNLPGPLTAVDVAGVTPQENWNNLAGAQFDLVPLFDAKGNATPVQVSTLATEHWYDGTLATGDADGVLLQGFLSAGASMDPMLVTLENVPAGTYNVIVYSIGFPFQASYEESIELIGGATYPTYRVKAENGLDYNANPAFRRMSSTDANSRDEGNYVQFDNVSPTAGGLLEIAAIWESINPGNSHQPAINGIQLVKVLPITQRPTLGVVGRQGSTLTLSWGGSATGFVLESSSSLTGGAVWTAVGGAPNPINGQGTATINLSGAGAFFRLKK
ncbi:MAG: hypothetical protein O2960_28295 [Verrucomicrobia bacterium]|nr:hypothetical protein [Verrucomicrobiota bacterium]